MRVGQANDEYGGKQILLLHIVVERRRELVREVPLEALSYFPVEMEAGREHTNFVRRAASSCCLWVPIGSLLQSQHQPKGLCQSLKTIDIAALTASLFVLI
jgi:hypothetical protein